MKFHFHQTICCPPNYLLIANTKIDGWMDFLCKHYVIIVSLKTLDIQDAFYFNYCVTQLIVLTPFKLYLSYLLIILSYLLRSRVTYWLTEWLTHQGINVCMRNRHLRTRNRREWIGNIGIHLLLYRYHPQRKYYLNFKFRATEDFSCVTKIFCLMISGIMFKAYNRYVLCDLFFQWPRLALLSEV